MGRVGRGRSEHWGHARRSFQKTSSSLMLHMGKLRPREVKGPVHSCTAGHRRAGTGAQPKAARHLQISARHRWRLELSLPEHRFPT